MKRELTMESFKEFRSICQPSAKMAKDTIIGRLLYRKLSIYLTGLFVCLRFSANMVSLLGIIVGLSGVSLFALSPNVKLHFAGVILLQISVVIDYSDGEVARYRRYQADPGKAESNISGAYIDNMGHFILLPLGVFFFGYRAIHYFPDWSVFILVLSFLTAMAVQGIPNLVMSHMIVDSMQCHPELMENHNFRAIASGQINIILVEENQLSRIQRLLFVLARLYKGLDVFSIISLEILVELLLCYFGYTTIASFVGLGVLVFLFVLHTLNFLRTFRRDFLYLSKPF